MYGRDAENGIHVQTEAAKDGSTVVLATRAGRVWLSLALLAAALVVTVPAYAGLPSQDLRLAYRFGLPLLWGGLAWASSRSRRLAPFRTVLWSLFGVSLGFALAYLVGDHPLRWLGLSTGEPRGAAADKLLAEVLPISGAILLATTLAGKRLAWLGLRRGRLGLSLGLGLLSSVPLLGLFVLDPSGGSSALLALPAATILAWLPWIGLFAVANAFMEELWFRGAWLSAFGELVGPTAAMHVTSFAFCIAHVIVYRDEPVVLAMLTLVWLYMGYAYALILRRTGTLWGAVLAHTIADVLFLLVAFATGQAL